MRPTTTTIRQDAERGYAANGDSRAAEAVLPHVVLVHGFPLHGGMWHGVTKSSFINIDCFCPDLRGFGQNLSAEPCSIQQHAQELHNTLEQRGLLPCVLCGLSMGGYVAMEFVEQFPDDVLGLMLLNTRAKDDSDGQAQSRVKLIRTVRRKGLPGVVDQMLPGLLSDQALREDGLIVDTLTNMMLDCPPITIEYASVAMGKRVDCSDAMKKVTMPVSIVASSNDTITPPDTMRDLHDCFDDSEFRLIEGPGHLTAWEAPDRVAAEIDRLVKRVRRKAATKPITKRPIETPAQPMRSRPLHRPRSLTFDI